MKLSSLIRFLVLLGLALGQTELSAGNFRISPVQVFLDSGQGSALITIYNEGEQSVRFQISANAWSQSEAGEIQLADTEEILFFPKLLEVAPKSERKVRVASSVKPGDREKTYRLFFDELPAPPKPGKGATVSVLTKMGVPIFITPRGTAPLVETEASVAAGSVRVDVRNAGTSHATLQEIRVRGTAADGTEVFSERRDGWYLLADSLRRYEVSLGEKCNIVSELVVEAVYTAPETQEPQTITKVVKPADGVCVK